MRLRYLIRPTVPEGSVTVMVERTGTINDRPYSMVGSFNTLALALDYCREGYQSRGMRPIPGFSRDTEGDYLGPWIDVKEASA
jgi:hypothetical protein